MIRHMKSQRINGATALALPESSSSIEIIQMTPREENAYLGKIAEKRDVLMRMRSGAAKFYTVRNQIVYSLTSPLLIAESSKIKALEKSITNLMKRNPNIRVVVFTQMRQQLQYIQDMVKHLGMQTPGGIGLYSFDGSSSHKKRDDSIRSFQTTADQGPAVIVITLNTGSVGITFTAASQFFLMEPSIDPAEEIQAAGRINCLGQ
jgi:SNF2 family DNA or RNA helicase